YNNGFGSTNGGVITFTTPSLSNSVVTQGFFFGAPDSAPQASNQRPDTRITQCRPPPGAFTYTWSPPTNLPHPVTSVPTDTDQTIIATPTSTIDYLVEVTDGSCFAYDTVTITFYNDYDGNISGRNSGCYGTNDGDLVSTP